MSGAKERSQDSPRQNDSQDSQTTAQGQQEKMPGLSCPFQHARVSERGKAALSTCSEQVMDSKGR